MKCAHCGQEGQWFLDRCDECAKHGHADDVEACQCTLFDGPGIVGGVPYEILTGTGHG